MQYNVTTRQWEQTDEVDTAITLPGDYKRLIELVDHHNSGIGGYGARLFKSGLIQVQSCIMHGHLSTSWFDVREIGVSSFGWQPEESTTFPTEDNPVIHHHG